jgi:CRP/FNR family transcriptional regulator
LYWPRDTRAYVYSIYRGSLKTYRPLHDCSERISGFHFPGELLGLDALFGLPARRGAVALDAATVMMIPVTTLIEHLGRCETTRLELLGHFNDETARLEEHPSLAHFTAEERLAAFVLWVVDKLSPETASPTMSLPMSQKDIGNYLGLVPETVSRLFARFEERRWLSMRRRALTVRDLDQLRHAAG